MAVRCVQLTDGDWRFYFVAALMCTLEAASYQRALGQSQYLRMDPRSLKTDSQLYGVDATLVQGEKSKLVTEPAPLAAAHPEPGSPSARIHDSLLLGESRAASKASGSVCSNWRSPRSLAGKNEQA